MTIDVAETTRILRELAAGNQLIGLEAAAERDGQGVKNLGPGQRLLVNRTDRGYTYHEAQGSSGGRITRAEALGLLQATLSTEDCGYAGQEEDQAECDLACHRRDHMEVP